ncbi:hypothetical protein [Streptomyces sp. MUSC 14]|uniref:hypothetical protein n=1 Tax=Streptomyces sp. MUSC 14 TaxID=1354889 RepID=UPI001160C64D|nr:hypothetical protein [Streptomyces sp. MUSC 14]
MRQVLKVGNRGCGDGDERAGHAPRHGTNRADSVKPACAFGEITGSGNLSNAPTSRKAGQNLVTYTTVRNAKSAPLPGVFFDYQMAAPSNHKGATPTVWWKFNGGSWQHMIMTWNPATKVSTAQWEGGDAVLGSPPSNTTCRLEMTVDYPSGATRGFYAGTVLAGAKTCESQLLGAFPVSTAYEPR